MSTIKLDYLSVVIKKQIYVKMDISYINLLFHCMFFNVASNYVIEKNE